MNKKAFTLVELLAVITILAIISLIIVPLVLNTINSSKEESRKDSIRIYARSIENAVANYFAKYTDENEVTLETLEAENLLNYKGSKVKCDYVQISKMKVYLKDCSVDDTRIDFEYGEYDPVPELSQGLVPVIYENDKWIVVSQYSSSWYDYDKQKWANAVTLLPGVTKEVGDEVAVDGTEASMMFVWIPRYEYKYTNLGNQYAGGTQEQPGGISINFIPKEMTESSDSSQYKIHPAFKFGDKELGGIWIGKFELSSTDYSTSSSNLRVLPNVLSLRDKSVSDFFTAIKSIESDQIFNLKSIDSHMIKNSEWGAVAYLSQSKYGKYGNADYDVSQKEIYINNSIAYAGRSGGNVSGNTQIKDTYTDQTSTTQYNSYGYYTYDGYLLEYNTNNQTSTRDIKKGTGASTTGNIYGVYDMNGGTSEYAMGVYADNEGIYSGPDSSNNSGFKGKNADGTSNTAGIDLPDFKYYEKYITTASTTACNGICYGHALSETSGWYLDYAHMPSVDSPWFVLGGASNNEATAGIFHYGSNYGSAFPYYSSRIVIVLK